MTLFVTVGTTKFEPLIDACSTPLFFRTLCDEGVQNLVLQIGQGRWPESIFGADKDATKKDQDVRVAVVDCSAEEMDGKVDGVASQKLPPISTDTLTEELGSTSTKKLTTATSTTKKLVKVYVLRFLSNITAVQRLATVIVSHAGAGSILGALRMRRRLCVVVNAALMDNHQSELATAVKEGNYARVVDMTTTTSSSPGDAPGGEENREQPPLEKQVSDEVRCALQSTLMTTASTTVTGANDIDEEKNYITRTSSSSKALENELSTSSTTSKRGVEKQLFLQEYPPADRTLFNKIIEEECGLHPISSCGRDYRFTRY
ncbi:unnamed protein product [Amoebophrya sp. A25]|nr:unnamed protein product [Amoebophrya sp. A25]|eukprot:GSA25T00004968001.1